MTWPETHNKRKDTKLMKEFANWLASLSAGSSYGWIREHLGDDNIKDIYGYLLCFAETKGIEIFAPDCQIWDTNKKDNYVLLAENGGCGDGKQMEYEQAMNWCASKFFEVANEKK